MVSSKIILNSSGMVRTLVIIALVLVILSTATRYLALSDSDEYLQRLSGMFYVDAEGNLPTLFSVGLLLIAGLLLFVIVHGERARGAKFVSHWMTLSMGFFLMAIDEAVSVHEKFVRPIKSLLGMEDGLGPFYFIWVVPGLAMVIGLAVFFVKFLLHLPTETRLSFLVAATLYLGGAIGIEMVEGIVVEIVGTENFLFSTLSTLEESLEMAGVIIFIRASFAYIAAQHREVGIVFK